MLREVQIPRVPGRLFLTSMPGRFGALDEDLLEIGSCSLVVILTSEEEIVLKSPGYGRWLATRHPDARPRLLRCPIGDFGAPPDVAGFASLAKQVGTRLEAGDRIVVHCAAGIGRTGTFAACVLVLLGLSTEEALRRVRAAGSGPETEAQRAVVHTLGILD